MQENETKATPTEAITAKLRIQEIPYECFPATVTHPIAHFRLRCLDLAMGNGSFATPTEPEDIIKTAQMYADFLFLANGGEAPKTKPYVVGERGLEVQSSLPPGKVEPLISQAEQRLHTLRTLFDDIDPNPHSVCNLEAAHYKMTIRLSMASKNLKEAQEAVETLQEEIDNLALDIIQHGNADFLLKQGQPLPAREKWRADGKRKRLWERKAEEVVVS